MQRSLRAAVMGDMHCCGTAEGVDVERKDLIPGESARERVMRESGCRQGACNRSCTRRATLRCLPPQLGKAYRW